jgi:hypothetical protein
MSRRWGGGLAACGVVLAVGATRVDAQPGTPPGTRRAPEWRFDVDGGGGYESNARFQRPDDDGDIVRRIRADAAVAWVARTSVALTASGDLTSYQTIHDLDHFNYATGLLLSHAASTRLTTGLALSASSSLTPDLAQGGVSLPLAPLSTTNTRVADGTLSWRASSRTTTTLDARARQVSYGSSLLRGGTSAALNGMLQHRTSQWITVGADVQGEETSMNGVDYLAEAIAGNWSFVRGPLAVRLRAGGLGVRTRGAARYDLSEVADAEVSHTVRRSLIASLRGGRAVTPTLGLGRVLETDYVGAALERRSLRGTSVRLSVDDATSSDLSATSFHIHSTSASVDLRRPFHDGTWVGLGAFYRQRDQRGLVSGHGLQLTLGHATRP